jgi:hypothetical protein
MSRRRSNRIRSASIRQRQDEKREAKAVKLEARRTKRAAAKADALQANDHKIGS